jgi:uncharacterized protein YjbJ (UPF0337 family)
MDKQRVKGAVDQVVGSTKSHIGNMTGDTRTRVEGAVQQVKGKIETTVGKVKDGVRHADAEVDAQQKAEDRQAAREGNSVDPLNPPKY